MSRDFVLASSQYLIGGPTVLVAPFSVAAWINPDTAAPTTDMVVWETGIGSSSFRWRLLVEGSTVGDRGKVRWVATQNFSNTRAQTAGAIVGGAWQHVCGVEAAVDDRRVYLGGTADKGTDGTTKNPGASAMTTTTVGRRNQSNGDFWDGFIAHVCVWNAALTDDEVNSLAGGAHPRQIRPDNIFAYWPINGRAPEPDVVSGVDLTVTNGPTKAEEPPTMLGNYILAA